MDLRSSLNEKYADKEGVVMSGLRILFSCLVLCCLSSCSWGKSATNEQNIPPTTETHAFEEEVDVEIVTPEATPTTATCTPLPDDMTIEILARGELHGDIEVSGLQPEDAPILLLRGQSSSGIWQKDTQPTKDVIENGRFRDSFDFRTWESIEGYQFSGQLIHNRGVACFNLDLPLTDDQLEKDLVYEPPTQPVLPLTEYPPSDTPYYIEDGDFWLIHAPTEQLLAFVPVSPAYKTEITVEPCRFAWSQTNQHFLDSCSGDEWDLLGELDLEHSPDSWSQRNLNQYALSMVQDNIIVQVADIVQGQSITERPLAVDAQFGITVTAVTTHFSPTMTLLDTLIQADPLWEMDPTMFPPQQLLPYPTTTHSLVDNLGRESLPTLRESSLAVVDPKSGGMQQMSHLYWEAVATDAQVVTHTLTVELGILYRQFPINREWGLDKVGDAWMADIPFAIGHAAIKVEQIEWIDTLDDGRAQLRLTVSDDSPKGIRINCLHVVVELQEGGGCAQFEEIQTYVIAVPQKEPFVLHMRVGVELLQPFVLTLDVQ